MDWTLAIDRNRDALKQVLAALLTMAGLSGGIRQVGNRQTAGADGPTADCPFPLPATLPRHLHRAVLRLLRPAEAAARRLVILAARGMRDLKSSPAKRGRGTAVGGGGGLMAPHSGVGGLAQSHPRKPCLPLFDPPSRFARRRYRAASAMPRISLPGITHRAPVRPAPMPFDKLDTTRLAFWLAGLAAALDDLPRHARRFARWQALRGRHADAASHKPRRIWPLRPGRPPGVSTRTAKAHPVHDVLDTVHGLALMALEPADTS